MHSLLPPPFWCASEMSFLFLRDLDVVTSMFNTLLITVALIWSSLFSPFQSHFDITAFCFCYLSQFGVSFVVACACCAKNVFYLECFLKIYKASCGVKMLFIYSPNIVKSSSSITRMSSIHLSKPSCRTSNPSAIRGSICKRPKESTTRNMRRKCPWRRSVTARRNYRYEDASQTSRS